LLIAKHCAAVCAKQGIEYIFKASYDKANRSSMQGKRGIGLEETMNDFAKMKQEIAGLKILTDVHDIQHIGLIEEWPTAVDVLQIPAFLCRQTDLIQAACRTDKIVNIKKGQFLAPWDVAGILSKTGEAKEVWVTERGTSFGYNTLIVDYTGLDYMLSHYDNVVFDVTHAVQKPGGNGDSSGGNREYVPGLARAASALGVQNFFVEVHTDPDHAPSDGPNMLKIEDFESVVDQIVRHNYKR
jgi:2-dehydro-3-deoxyphosphooctonate aldolase (KDO 8-P synthase)